MAEQTTRGENSLEQSQAAWTNFLRLTRVVVALSALVLLGVAFATL